jgi:hypothetical protein
VSVTSAGNLITRLVQTGRDLDVRWQRRRRPHVRTVVFDARTAMEYGMMAPVHQRLLADSRIRTCLMASDRPDQAAKIFREAPPATPIVKPREAMLRRFDAYVAADLVWATLPRGTRRVQMFHGVAGKFRREYDSPDRSMRQWDRLFFINRRRLQNFIASGAIDRDSTAIRLVGMPKIDCLVDGSLRREQVLAALGIDPAATTVMYAPTWTRFSSLNAMGEELVRALVAAGYTVLVKLHDLSLDPAVVNSGGIDWRARLAPILARGRGHFITAGDATRWLAAADVLVTDHSSIGFEYLLLDRPVVRIAMPQLVTGADLAPEYVQLLASASTTFERADQVAQAVAAALRSPEELSNARRSLAAEFFHAPGGATDRATRELYALIELDAPQQAEHEIGDVTPAAVRGVAPVT